MKPIPVTAHHVLSLEKNDRKNPTGMQLRIWKLDHGMIILVRLYAPVDTKDHRVWPKKLREYPPVIDGAPLDESLGPPTNVLRGLKKLKIIKKIENWSFSRGETDRLSSYDESREDVGVGKFLYLAYQVRDRYNKITNLIDAL